MIVNVSSGTSLMNLPNMSPYSGLKRALNALSLAAREELKRDNIVVSVVYPYMTATDFEENTIKDSHIEWDEGDERDLPPPDPPEYVAEKILEAIETEAPEVYAHDWMGNRALSLRLTSPSRTSSPSPSSPGMPQATLELLRPPSGALDEGDADDLVMLREGFEVGPGLRVLLNLRENVGRNL